MDEELEGINTKITKDELTILRLLAVAWGKFFMLDDKSSEDNRRFSDSLSECQRIITHRIARRAFPVIFGLSSSREEYKKHLSDEIEKLKMSTDADDDESRLNIALLEIELNSLK